MDQSKIVKSTELSNEAHCALWYALASIPNAKPKNINRWNNGKAKVIAERGERGLRAVLHKGLEELAQKNLISLKRDAEGSYQPVGVNLELLDIDESGIIKSDGV